MTAAVRKKLNQEINAFIQTFSWPEVFPFPHRRITYNDFLSDRILLISAIREGIPYGLFELIQAVSPFSEGDWAEILQLSTKSLQCYKQEPGCRFESLYSEKIMETAEVVQVGLKVFGETEQFKLWLNTPNFEMGMLKPFELLRDSYGKDLVLSELYRIGQSKFP